MAATTGPEGVDALFGVVQLATTIVSAPALFVALVACVFFVVAWRQPASYERNDRLRDLGRIGLIGAASGLAVLVIGELVVTYGTPTGGSAPFVGGVPLLVVAAVVLTVVAAAFFVVARRR